MEFGKPQGLGGRSRRALGISQRPTAGKMELERLVSPSFRLQDEELLQEKT
jgi:hypothetical protein